MDFVFSILQVLDNFFWSYIGFTIVVLSGLYFTIRSRFFQFRALCEIGHSFRSLHESAKENPLGIHPIKLYFASIGGMIGVGNIVAVITALLLGGPGGLFWLWVAGICGMLIKYAEIYLGLRFRVPNKKGGYDGGPMFYLQHAFHNRAIPIIVGFLLCIYGVEVLQFLVITDTMVYTFDLNRYFVIAFLLAAILYTALGGINRLAKVCTVLMPAFIVLYIFMCLWVIICNIDSVPNVLRIVIHSAFNGHAALGGFAGSTFMLAAQQGIARAVYSGDIGIGYDATIQAESKVQHPEKQARLAIFALATDMLVCTMSMMVVLVTNLWHSEETLQASQYVAKALAPHFPFVDSFMAFFFLLAGFTTITAYFAVGVKSSVFLSETWGRMIYLAYAVFAFCFFSFFDQTKVMLIMSLSGGLLMMFNLMGIIRLRHHIHFH